MIRGLVVLLIGLFLLGSGLAAAARAPLGARDDVRAFWEGPSWRTGTKSLNLQNSDEFYQAHLTKRFLTSGVLSLAGVGLVVVGVTRMTVSEDGSKSTKQ